MSHSAVIAHHKCHDLTVQQQCHNGECDIESEGTGKTSDPQQPTAEHMMVEGMSTREAARVFGLHRDTVRKMLEYSAPEG